MDGGRLPGAQWTVASGRCPVDGGRWPMKVDGWPVGVLASETKERRRTTYPKSSAPRVNRPPATAHRQPSTVQNVRV